jgi:hypothetical protein
MQGDSIAADSFSVEQQQTETMEPARLQVDGFVVEVEPIPGPESWWQARVLAQDGGENGPWHAGRHAWQAMEAAALHHRLG